MEWKIIVELISDFKEKIRYSISKGQYNEAMELINSCASLLYGTNQYYIDDELEESIRTIADSLFVDTIERVKRSELKQDTVLFYDGFGLDFRGLAHIYVEALVQEFNVHYVTYADREKAVPDILRIVQENGGTVSFINKERPIGIAKQLNEILHKSRAEKFIFYSYPYDVAAVALMYAYNGVLTRYQINLTDHAFWLGAKAIDKCIEFRDYGACISSEYRGIPRERIVKLPFYPKVVQQQFQGFPFPVKDGQKVVFSGGSLYKTFGEGNKYYKIVDYILDKHSDVIFWYAGSGDDSELKKCMMRHPGRVFHTPERTDLFQILQRVNFYLSTYPICGGLMYQYAAAAGVMPLTLRRDDCNDGFLLNQDTLGVIFDTMEELEQEIDRVLTDEPYRQARSVQMRSAVISPEQFSAELSQIMKTDKSPQEICYRHIDTEAFRANYLIHFFERDILWYCIRKDTFRAMLRYFPAMALKGIGLKLRLKISGKL